MTALFIALVSALGLALGHSDQGTEEELEHSGYSTTEEDKTDEVNTSALTLVSTEVLTADTNSTLTDEPPDPQGFVLMVAIPLAALVILLSVVLLAVYLKNRRHKQEPSSQGSQSALQTYEPIGENLKVPIFEEDTPSVMEIEMEELDKWMSSMSRNADHECLPTLKEEKEPNLSPSKTWAVKTWDLLSLFTSNTECFFFFPYWTQRPAGYKPVCVPCGSENNPRENADGKGHYGH
ncbi:transmembrane protein 154 [Microtus ochrogaster]|uniref:Transmembrane protein 154 n=1 Tax=Microtus ochrogaster TaxID=79684 RepID=A0ABM1TYE3_MICOH|nr:transmembrane protein 154 [Microtus ochrogaster]